MHQDAPNSKTRAAPLKGLDPDSLALSSDPDFLELIQEARGQVERGEVISLAELEAELGGP